MDRLGTFLSEKTPRRIIAMSLFAGLLVLFRHLLILLVFFVVFERLLSIMGTALHHRTKLHPKAAHGIVALLVLALIGGLLAMGVGRAIRAGANARDTLPARIAAIKQMPIYQTVQEHVQDAADQVIDRAQHYAGGA